MEEIKFYAHQLIIDKNEAELIDLTTTFSEQDDLYTDGEYHYQIQKECLNNNSYFWFYSCFGKPYPHTDQVFDIESKQLEENPRKTTQIEPNKQLFCLYDFSNKILYLSNSQKKKLLEKYLKSKIEKDVIVKNFYSNPDTFANAITSVNSIKLVTKKNLFSIQSGLFSEAKNIFGLDEPEDFTLETRFKKAKKTDDFVKIFKSFASKRASGEIESLVCVGYDDSNVENIFNADNLIKKTVIYLKKDEQGLFKPDEVKAQIIKQIKPEEENV